MDLFLCLLPGEHIAAFPGRFHRLNILGELNKSYKYLGLIGQTQRSQRLLCSKQHVLHQRLAPEDYYNSWNDNAFGRLVGSFLKPEELALMKQSLEDFNNIPQLGERRVKNDGWRWCYQCVLDDQDAYGIPYYHRDHQIPGVFHCQKHRQRLSSFCKSCGFNVPILRSSLLPPMNNICPSCGVSIYPDDGYYDTMMGEMEDMMVRLVYTGIHYSLTDFTEHIARFIGVDFTQKLESSDMELIKEWERYISTYLSENVQNSYFKIHKTGVSHSKGLLCHPRLYRDIPKQGMMHPLVHLIALRATSHELFKG